MPNHEIHDSQVTQITCVTCEPGKQAEALSVMTERAEFMLHQPGFISVRLHRSFDGERIVNVMQWENRELLHAAHQSPEFRRVWNRFDQLTGGIDPHLYEVAYVKGGGNQSVGQPAPRSEKHQEQPAPVEAEAQHGSQTILDEARNVNHVSTHR